MIGEMFGLLATIFPWLVFTGIVFGLALMGLTWSRVSSGSVGAGPARVQTPRPTGLAGVPWELHGVREALHSGGSQPLDLLLSRARQLQVPVQVPEGANTVGQVASVLDQLERALDLPPLEVPAPPGPPPATPND